MTLSREYLNTVCDKLATGKSLRAICREQEIPESTVRQALNADEEIYAQYVRARELQADAIFDDILDIADKGEKALDDREDRRLQIEARKWMAGKLKGKYSDKVKHVGGDEGDSPIAFTGFDIRFV